MLQNKKVEIALRCGARCDAGSLLTKDSLWLTHNYEVVQPFHSIDRIQTQKKTDNSKVIRFLAVRRGLERL